MEKVKNPGLVTGFINGKWQISTHTESTPHNQVPKNVTAD